MCSQRGNDVAVAETPLATARKHYKTLVEYLLMKVEQKDWHGVADAAMDIRDIIAAHPDVELSEPTGIVPSEMLERSWSCRCGTINLYHMTDCQNKRCGARRP